MADTTFMVCLICLASFVVLAQGAPTNDLNEQNVAAPVPPVVGEPITVERCMDMEYDLTIFPNFKGHQNQDEAREELDKWSPLISFGCSKHVARFLCSYYMPRVSNTTGQALPPCRNLCNKARGPCMWPIRLSGNKWPDFLSCDLFPDEDSVEVCTRLTVA